MCSPCWIKNLEFYNFDFNFVFKESKIKKYTLYYKSNTIESNEEIKQKKLNISLFSKFSRHIEFEIFHFPIFMTILYSNFVKYKLY